MLLLVAGLMAGVSSVAFANPMDGVVTGGAATIISTPAELQIHQTSNKALIEWKSFDIGAGETTRFYQPGANAVALNRVVNSNQLSAINGNLLANGKVLIINPNGVLIGGGAHIDTAGFIASTADMADSAFMNSTGAYDFNRPGHANASVENQGRITVRDEGLVALVAPTVRNSGLIEGNLAKIRLAAGDTFGVDMYGDGLLYLAVAAPLGPDVRSIVAENSGMIFAHGGKVLMTAAAASDMVDAIVNNSGVIEARSLTSRGGEVTLTGEGAAVSHSGSIDVSGATGGGSVNIGGGAGGAGNLAKAKTVEIGENAVVRANATGNGDGGSIAVWSQQRTASAGRFEAKGGAQGGNGGFVETSSKGALQLAGTKVDTSAALGHYGYWVIDPVDLVVDAALAQTISDAVSDVFLTADNNITFAADIAMKTPFVNLTASSGAGGITGLNNYIRTNHGNLTFETIGPLALNGFTIYTRGGDVNLTSQTFTLYNNSGIGTGGGDVNLNGTTLSIYNGAAIDTQGGAFDLTGVTASLYNNAAISTGGGAFDVSGTTVSFYTGPSISTGGGDMNLAGTTFSIYDSTIIGTAGGDFDLSGTTVNIYADADIGTGGGMFNVTGDTVSIYGNAAIATDGGAAFIAATGALSVLNTSIDTSGGVLAGGIDLLDATGTPFAIPSQNGTPTDAEKALFFGAANNFDSSQPGGRLTLQGATAGGTNNCFNAGGALACAPVSAPLEAVVDDPLAAVTLMVTADGQGKIYGAADPLFTYNYSGALDSADSFTGALARAPGETVLGGPYAITQGTLAVDGIFYSYLIDYTPGAFSITPAPLTISADNQSMIYGGVLPMLTASYSGFVNNDSIASLTTAPMLASATASSADAGTYLGTLGASGATNSNYAISYETGDLTIGQASLSVAADDQSKAYGAADPAFTYLAGALLPGNSFGGGLSRDAGETAGIYAINLGTLSAGSNYQIAYSTNDLTIGAAPTIVPTPPVEVATTQGPSTRIESLGCPLVSAADNLTLIDPSFPPSDQFTLDTKGAVRNEQTVAVGSDIYRTCDPHPRAHLI